MLRLIGLVTWVFLELQPNDDIWNRNWPGRNLRAYVQTNFDNSNQLGQVRWRWAGPSGRYSSPLQWRSGLGMSVSPSVCYHEIRRTALRILAKLGQKSKGDELGTVTRPDFPGKILLINYSWKQVLAIFSSLGPRVDLILHIMIVQNVSQHLAMVRGHA